MSRSYSQLDEPAEPGRAAREASRGSAPGDSDSDSIGPVTAGMSTKSRIYAAIAFFVVVGVVVGVVVAVSSSNGGGNGPSPSPTGEGWKAAAARVCRVMCNGTLLTTVQRAKLHNDSKTFVDQPLLADPEDVLKAFDALGAQPTKAQLAAFLQRYFGTAGSDLLPWTPTDWVESPSMFARIANSSVRAWAGSVNQLWKELGRQVAPEVKEHPERHTLVALKHPVVVPGGRFRETYYWDTYWIVRGLLACGMKDTAKGLVQNLLDEVEAFGFVPNGGRAYYLSRSQPPFLSDMVAAVAAATCQQQQSVRVGAVDISVTTVGSDCTADGADFDEDFLRPAFATLEKEYAFWMEGGEFGHAVNISVGGDSTTVHTLNRFVSDWPLPRPESFLEDEATVADAGFTTASAEGRALLRNIAAGAETGWDFSSRWFGDGEHLSTIRTSGLAPVDLNSVLCRVERNLAALASQLGDTAASARYSAAATRRIAAMDALMWDEDNAQWFDLVLSTGAPNPRREETLSNFSPLWARAYDSTNTTRSHAVVDALERSGLLQPGGSATTTLNTEQQWDWPNAWAPLQQMLIEGLDGIGGQRASGLAKTLAREWLYTNYAAFQSDGFMFEKYDATRPGVGGGGGEYVPQRGFGWTNGVVLQLLQRYGPVFETLDP